MSEMKSYKELVSELETYVQKLESGSMTIDELFELEKLTRKLHERSIILRYKAFENKAGIQSVQEVQEPVAEVKEEPQPEPVKEEVVEEEPGLQFDLGIEEEQEEEPFVFEAPQEEEILPIEEEEVVEEPKAEETPEPEVKEEPQPEPVSGGTSFLDRFQTADNSLSSQFAGAKLTTLIGAFGLNEKLRFINDLFDGSSELFSDAIKALDSKASMDEANKLVEQLASEHEWDPEEETVSEFMVYIKRRYA